ncbi:MAG: hypothetical protein CVU90_08195 [Firmicutes bacterium HGW-Firmicutes-15]|nr:MAG: hypothetical protein CVU90_08195 [Firmicutes bacterium HGW-Firmicutes-15]
MKKKLLLTLSIVLGITFLSASVFLFNFPSKVMAKELNNNISSMMEEIDKGAKNDLATQLSSNPYDYTKDNMYFEKIVDMGYPALPLIEDYIQKSTQNGLREYLLAIASEKIAKVDLKSDGNGWSTAKMFLKEWDRHLKVVPSKATEILESNKPDADKALDLKKLGLPAAPFIIDYLDGSNGEHPEIANTLEYLVKDSKIALFTNDDYSNFINWSKMNKNKFNDLRNYVNKRK